MMHLKFNGWFQCRLATDPDPADEPRGVSGYMQALPGEPDLDRIIRFQPPFVWRSHTPQPGVFVRSVYQDGHLDPAHPLVNAAVNLLENPIFKGENGIVAEDGKEPIVPFILQVKQEKIALVRGVPEDPAYTTFPFPELQAVDVLFAPGQIAEATGIYNVRAYLGERSRQLNEDLQLETDPVKRENLRRRLSFLASGSATRFFAAMMPYFIPLAGKATVQDPEGILSHTVGQEQPWLVDFWMGSWDPDAACGFVQGYLSVP